MTCFQILRVWRSAMDCGTGPAIGLLFLGIHAFKAMDHGRLNELTLNDKDPSSG